MQDPFVFYANEIRRGWGCGVAGLSVNRSIYRCLSTADNSGRPNRHPHLVLLTLLRLRLLALRRSLNITQAEMAKMINVSQSTISQLENGVIEVSLVMLYSLIDHMGGELQINAVFDGKKVALNV